MESSTLGDSLGNPTERARASSAAIASFRACTRMWEYRRNMLALTCPIISSIVDSGTSRSWRDLFFRDNNNRLMVVNYTAKGDSFVADKPRLWSQAQLADPGFNGIPYDVAADGRVAGLMPLEAQEGPSSPSRLIFLENFVDELRRRVPLK